VISAGPAHFGRQLRGNDQVSLIIWYECMW
jgi:hypothetical protein